MATTRRSSLGAKLLVGLLVLLLLLGAAALVGDRYARSSGQDRVAASLQDKLGTAERPEVVLGGTPFLTQLMSNTYSDVRIKANDVTATSVPLQHLEANFTEVAANREFTQAVAKTASGRGVVSWDEVSKKVGNMPIRFVAPDRLHVEYNTNVFGISVVAQVTAKPTVDVSAQTIVLTEPQINIATIDIPQDMAESLMGTLVQPIPLPLPAGLTATGGQATAEGITMDFEGTDVDLTKL